MPASHDPIAVIKGATILAFEHGTHQALMDADLAFSRGEILHVGRSYGGHADQVIDGVGRLIIPGLISTHAHVGLNAPDRLILDHGRADLQRTGFLNYAVAPVGAPSTNETPAELRAAIRYGLACLLKSGVTTAIEMGGSGADGGRTMIDEATRSGIRLYYAPAVQGGTYANDRNGVLLRTLDECDGLAALARSSGFIREFDSSADGRIRGILVLDEFFNSTPLLRREIRLAADRLGVGITLHFLEQVYEFHECVARNGCTPVRLLYDTGFLGPDVILGHCLYVSGHRFSDHPGDDDLVILSASGATVAHCPVAVARRGTALESFGRFRDAGVRLSLGTDSYPLDLLAEMRWAAVIGRTVDRNANAVTAQEVFDAATLGGAEALGRPDLGRLEEGSAADFVVIRIDDSRFGFRTDTVQNLVENCSAELVQDVYIAGRVVVKAGEVLAWPVEEVLEDARASAAARWREFPVRHWTGSSPQALYPPAFPDWQPV